MKSVKYISIWTQYSTVHNNQTSSYLAALLHANILLGQRHVLIPLSTYKVNLILSLS